MIRRYGAVRYASPRTVYVINFSPASRKRIGRVCQTHDDRDVPAAAHAAHAVGDRVRLRGRVMTAAFLRKGAQSNAARLPTAAISRCWWWRLHTGQKGLSGAGSCARRHKAGDDVLEERGVGGLIARERNGNGGQDLHNGAGQKAGQSKGGGTSLLFVFLLVLF